MPRSTPGGPSQFRDSGGHQGWNFLAGGTFNPWVPRERAPARSNPVQAIASAVQDTGPATDYSRFYGAVAQAQLTAWLAELAPLRGVEGGSPPLGQTELAELAPLRRVEGGSPPLGQTELAELGHRGVVPRGQAEPAIIDISGPAARAAEVAVNAGHTVLRVVEPGSPAPAVTGYGAAGPRAVIADGTGLEFLADGCACGVIAEDGTLSRRLAAEALVSEIARVLRPGGLVLACVDSLTRGMAVLAEQHRWPHLIDVPNADVVLVPWPDGSITRCYGAEHLRELFTGSGLEVNWIRPRTVFSPLTVSYLLARYKRSFDRLVAAELGARCDDSVGAQLVVCAAKRSASAPIAL